MKPDHPKVATVVEFGGVTYKFKSAKRNVLVYVDEPYRDYYGYMSGGGILIISYNNKPNMSLKNRYYVLHEINLCGGIDVDTVNLTKVKDRHANPIKFE